MATTSLRSLHPQAPAPLRRTRPRTLRPPFGVETPAPLPAPSDETESLKPQAVPGALFSPPPAPIGKKEEERTAVTLPPARSKSLLDRGRGRLAAPEREFLALFGIALGLELSALFLDRTAVSDGDLLLSGAVLLSGLCLLALGCAARSRPQGD